MKKNLLSSIALLLSLVMIVGFLCACGQIAPPSTDIGKETEGVASESESKKEDTSETSGEDSSEEKTETNPSEGPQIDVVENEYDNVIDNAYGLSNQVQGYFNTPQRTHLVLENRQIELIYARANSKDQLITSLKSKSGNAYIENTMDVFVTMKNGNTFYASQSNINTVINFFRFGYYYYEARVEGQNFIYKVFPEKEQGLDISVNKSSSNGVVKIEVDKEGVLSFMFRPGSKDPYVVLDNIAYSAEEYNYLQFTMKTNIDTVSSGQIFYKTNGSNNFSEASSVSYAIKGDGEFHTYTIKLEGDNYKGNVTSLRLDVAGEEGSVCEIKDLKLIKGNDGGAPENLSIVRSFLVYSDKLHSFTQFASKDVATTDIASLGFETRIPKSNVAKVIAMDKDGLHESFSGVDWSSVEYVGFDIKDAGIFGYILPADGSGASLEVKEDGEGNYVIIQYATPENYTIIPSVEGTNNANDLFIGQRIYTDESHSFDDFIYEAYNERNPLNTIVVRKNSSTGGEEIKYDAMRGIYSISIDYDSFNPAFYRWPNKHYNISFAIKGDGSRETFI